MTAWPRFAARRSTRTVSGRTSSSAPRKSGPCASGRKRSPSARRSSPATPISSAASSSRRCARRRSRPTATSASGSTASARNARPASPTGSSRSERTSSRTPSSPSASRSRARRCRCGRRRRSSPSCPSTATARSSATSRATHPPRSTRRAASSCGTRTPRGRALRNRRSGRAQRRGEGNLRARARGAPPPGERGQRRRLRHARDRWFEALLGDEREEIPTSYHMSYMRRLSPLESTYTKERSVEVCLATLSQLGFDLANEKSIKLDLDDRPQKSPRACVIASDAPNVVHLITRAQGGLHDYQAFLHEAGHALHYAGVDPQLPYTFRNLSRDHALTEIYSFVLEAISREPAWHSEHFGSLGRGGAAKRRGDGLPRGAPLPPVCGRSSAFELEFWGGSRRTAAPQTGTPSGSARRRGPLPLRWVPRRHGRRLLLGRLPARVDPLGAAPRVPGARGRRGLVALAGDRRAPAGLFTEGTRPSSEEIAARIGFDPLDTEPLVSELAVVPDVAFDRFYRYDELTEILQGWAEERPELFHLESIGKSFEGATSGWRRSRASTPAPTSTSRRCSSRRTSTRSR